MANNVQQVDQNQVKFGQGASFTLLLFAFVFNAPWLVLLTAIFQFMSAAQLPFAPYRVVYQRLLLPSGILKAKHKPDHHAPHRFASFVGGLFDLVGALALFAGLPLLGWGLVWIVIILANLNVWLSFCMGCWMYYQFNRFGLPGFFHTPVKE